MSKISLIYGGGAIGSFLSCCLLNSNHKVFFLTRGENFKKIKKNGLRVNVFRNSVLKKRYFIKNDNNFNVINNLKKLDTIKFNNIFITTSINENLLKTFQNIEKYIDKKKTLIITPCTSIPFWWYECLKNVSRNRLKKNLHKVFKENIKRKNLVGMTMWLSGKIVKPGFVKISHIQRGFPIKEVYSAKKKQVDKLRKDIRNNCRSPFVRNIFSEIFMKSLNSLAFNLIALKFNQNNNQLSRNAKAKKEIKTILEEGDNILKFNNIYITQTPESRITQTLSSRKHTMSMLNAVKKRKKTELKLLWKSFEKVCETLRYKMSFTKKNLNIVKNKYAKYI